MTIPEVFYPFHFWWSFSYFLAWGYCKQLRSHRVCISSTFLDDGKLFFKVLVPIHMVTSSDREFQLFYIFTSASSILPKCALCIWKVQLCLAVVFICVFFCFLMRSTPLYITIWVWISSFVNRQDICPSCLKKFWVLLLYQLQNSSPTSNLAFYSMVSEVVNFNVV